MENVKNKEKQESSGHLYIIRHGQTDWNKIYKLQGRTDVPLCEEGIKMAKKAAKEYAPVHFDLCYTSPLIRARKTAELLLTGRDVPIIEDDRLKEMCFGIYEGYAHIFQHPEWPVTRIFKDPESYKERLEGAENFEDLYKRTGDFLKEQVYPKVEQGRDILIVGHGAMNSAIYCQVKNIPLKDFWKAGIENCKLMQLI